MPDIWDEDGDGDVTEKFWKEYRQHMPAELRERRERARDQNRYKENDRKLREANRQWSELSSGDDEHGRVRWIHAETGEVRKATHPIVSSRTDARMTP